MTLKMTECLSIPGSSCHRSYVACYCLVQVLKLSTPSAYLCVHSVLTPNTIYKLFVRYQLVKIQSGYDHILMLLFWISVLFWFCVENDSVNTKHMHFTLTFLFQTKQENQTTSVNRPFLNGTFWTNLNGSKIYVENFYLQETQYFADFYLNY